MSIISLNKQIRDAITDLLQPILPGGVDLHAFKKDQIKTGESVCVFFDAGEVGKGAQAIITEAELFVLVMTSKATDTDDTLDTIANLIDDQIDQNTDLGGLVELCQLSSWQYERENDSGFTALYLTYHIEF